MTGTAGSSQPRKPLGLWLLGAAGIAWILLSMFVVGFLVLRAGDAEGISSHGAKLVGVAGLGTWACGVVLIALKLIALVKQRQAATVLAALTPLICVSVFVVGPTAYSGDYWGGVPTVGVAVLVGALVLVATASVALLVFVPRNSDDAASWASASIRMPSAIAAVLAGAAGVVLTLWMLIWGTIWGGFAKTPWFTVSWGLILTPLWLGAFRLWRRNP